MMTDGPILAALAALCALCLLLAGGAVMSARLARADAARLRAAAGDTRREVEAARAEVLVARERLEGQGRQLAERDAALVALRQEADAFRQRHQDAEARCADAEARCAQASEGVKRLEAAAERLRHDHAEAVRILREEGAATLAAVRDEGTRTAERLRAVEGELSRLKSDHAALQAERDERLASAEREVQRLTAIRAEMTREFEALAARTLRETGTSLTTAQQDKLTELLTPFKEQVARFEAELRAVHQEADKDRAILAEQIRAVAAQAQSVSNDAANLARALKGDKQRQGAWGEAQLERYLELMGYRRDVDYFVQESRTDDEGDRRRPDVVLRMPGDKALVIDSKVSLNAYAEAVAAETDEDRDRWLRVHVQNVRDRVNELAARDYDRIVDGSIDMVMLFMPIEGAVSAAWAQDGELAAYAMSRGVGLVYPTSLLMALKTVRHLWNVEKRNRNAEDIADRAGKLYDKLATFIDSFQRVGSALDSAKKAHETALGQLARGNGNLVRQVEQLKNLGARTAKSLAIPHDAGDEPDLLPAPVAEEGVRQLPAAE
jgi:DNA recombination protein RmuC